MGYRVRMVSEIKYGEFGAYLATLRTLMSKMEAQGLQPGGVLVPTAGRNNEIVWEIEDPVSPCIKRRTKRSTRRQVSEAFLLGRIRRARLFAVPRSTRTFRRLSPLLDHRSSARFWSGDRGFSPVTSQAWVTGNLRGVARMCRYPAHSWVPHFANRIEAPPACPVGRECSHTATGPAHDVG